MSPWSWVILKHPCLPVADDHWGFDPGSGIREDRVQVLIPSCISSRIFYSLNKKNEYVILFAHLWNVGSNFHQFVFSIWMVKTLKVLDMNVDVTESISFRGESWSFKAIMQVIIMGRDKFSFFFFFSYSLNIWSYNSFKQPNFCCAAFGKKSLLKAVL